jgi:hypothetical protein
MKSIIVFLLLGLTYIYKNKNSGSTSVNNKPELIDVSNLYEIKYKKEFEVKEEITYFTTQEKSIIGAFQNIENFNFYFTGGWVRDKVTIISVKLAIRKNPSGHGHSCQRTYN